MEGSSIKDSSVMPDKESKNQQLYREEALHKRWNFDSPPKMSMMQ